MSSVEPGLKTSPAQLDSKPHSESDDSNGTQLDVTLGTPTIKLDRLGPMVVNSDGTLSRIANWGEMSDIEQERTLRVLATRNKIRLANEERKLQQQEAVLSEKTANMESH